MPDRFHTWLTTLFASGVALTIFGIGLIATTPQGSPAILWGANAIAIGLLCWAVMWPIWRAGRRAAQATLDPDADTDALEEWKRDLTRRPQQIESVDTRLAPAALARASEQLSSMLGDIHNQERLATARKLEVLLLQGEDLNSAANWPYPTGMKDACQDWFERVIAALPPTKKSAVREIGIWRMGAQHVPRSMLLLNPALISLAGVIDDLRHGK